MKFGVVPVNVGAAGLREQLGDVGAKAEEVGLESVWTFEHAMVPRSYESTYPYAKSGKMPIANGTLFVDPWIALTYVAARTTRLRLGTGINILPQANPLLFGKQAASLDFVSNGRLVLGVGAGWLREEYDALGVPFEQRGARMDDYVVALKKVFAGGVIEHKSEFIQWSNFECLPASVQQPRPPILIGGASKAALRRVARHGDGWYAPNGSVEDLKRGLQVLRELCDEEGRDMASVEITASWLFGRESIDVVPQYRDLGVTRLVVPARLLGGRSIVEGFEHFGDQVIAKLA